MKEDPFVKMDLLSSFIPTLWRITKEDPFVKMAMRAAEEVLGPPLSVNRGAALLYQVTVNNRLEVCEFSDYINAQSLINLSDNRIFQII